MTRVLTKAPKAPAIADDPNRKKSREKDVLMGSVSEGMSYMHPEEYVRFVRVPLSQLCTSCSTQQRVQEDLQEPVN